MFTFAYTKVSMLPPINKIKGIHPGSVLRKELELKGISATELASATDEHKQTISAIMNKKRAVTPKLSIKLGQFFDTDTAYFSVVQAYFDVEQSIRTDGQSLTSSPPSFRKVLFWDTNYDRLDWNRNKRPIIRRIMERGDEWDIIRLVNYYGKQTVEEALRGYETHLPSFEKNRKRFLELKER